MLTIFASTVDAQHSLQVDDGAGNIGILTAPTSGGTTMFTLPSSGGMLITTGTTATNPWLLQGNALSALGASPTQWFGTSTNDDVIMKANGVEKLRLVSGGGVVIPGTALSIGGVAYTFPAAAPNGVLTNTAGLLSWAVAASSGWATTGNAGTTYGTNFLGTTDAVDLMFKVNSQVAGRIERTTAVTALGYQALNVNTGTSNTAVGYFALRSNTTGFWNTALGEGALASNTIGIANTASGLSALTFNTTASRNVALGTDALRSQSFSNGGVVWISNNTAVGYEALRNNQPTSTGDGINNTAVGAEALRANTTGAYNTASGSNALRANSTGNSNTASGENALLSNTTGSLNTASGASALLSNTIGSYNTAAGVNALNSNAFGNRNTAMGIDALAQNTIGSYNTALGGGALQNNTTASQNVAIGHEALRTQSFSNGGAVWISNNTAVGFEALLSNQPTSTSNGVNNTATGYQALKANTTGTNNTASGASALAANTTGNYNTAIGVGSLFNNTTGINNTSSGENTLSINTTGSNNTAYGQRALYVNTTGSNNTALGYHADVSSVALTNATAIGYNATVDASNKIQLGDGSVTLVSTEGDYQTGLGDKMIFRNPAGTFNTTFKAGAQLVALDYTLPIVAPTAGQVLSSDAGGVLSWAAATADLSPAVILAPTTSTRNVIQPTAATVVPLTVKGFASQSANLQEWQNSAGAVRASIGPSGSALFDAGITAYAGSSFYGGTTIFAGATNSYTLNVSNITSGSGTSGTIYVDMPTAKVGGTNNGIAFNVVGGVGTANDIVGTGNTWKVTSAGAFTLNGLTASSLVATNASKTLVSVANGTGVLTNNGSGTLSWVAAGLVNFTESLTTAAPYSATDAAARLLATNATATNIAVVLQPKGTGGLQAQLANNAASGGNKRGQYAVDWQLIRAASTQVASGDYATIAGGFGNRAMDLFSTISGGADNLANNQYATIGGGTANTAGYQAVVAGGEGNTASGSGATVAGGSDNVSSANVSTVGGGVLNTANAGYSVVAGGNQNTASGSYATVSGGEFNVASSIRSTISGGGNNSVSGFYSSISGGYLNVVIGDYSSIGGGRGLTLDATANGSFGFLGGNTGSNNMTISAANTAVFGNTDLWLGNNDGAAQADASQLRFYEPNATPAAFPVDANHNYVALRAPESLGANYTLTLPLDDGTANQVLQTDGSGVLAWTNPAQTLVYGESTPAAIAANTNDYALLTSTGTSYRISSTAAFNITGIDGGAGGRCIILTNVGTFNITLTHQDVGSTTAGNRFLLPGGGNVTIGADGAATLVYDGTSLRWRLVSTN